MVSHKVSLFVFVLLQAIFLLSSPVHCGTVIAYLFLLMAFLFMISCLCENVHALTRLEASLVFSVLDALLSKKCVNACVYSQGSLF
jgi:hypothetical protein